MESGAVFHAFTTPPQDVTEQALAAGTQNVPAQFALGIKRLLFDPQYAEWRKAQEDTPQPGDNRWNNAEERTHAHYIAALTPIVGPVAGNLVDRYLAGDKAGALGELGSYMAAPAAVDVASDIRAPIMKSSAIEQMGRVLAPTKAGNKYLSETQVAPGLVERGTWAISLKGLQKQAQQSIQQTGQLISDAWADLPQGTSVELELVWNKLEQSAQDALTIQTPTGPKHTTAYAQNALNNLDSMKELLLDVSEPNPTTGKLEVPVDKLRQLRQAWDGVAALSKRYQGAQLADYATGEIHGMAADAIRQQLGQQFPDIAALNKEYSFWKNVDQVVGDTITRRTGQAKPLGQKLAQAAGTGAGFAVGGIPGAVLGREAMAAVEKATTSTAWGTVSAVMKDRLADAMAAGDTQAVIHLTSRIAAAQAAPPSAQDDSASPYRQATAQRQ